jgi:hypothetical protein
MKVQVGIFAELGMARLGVMTFPTIIAASEFRTCLSAHAVEREQYLHQNHSLRWQGPVGQQTKGASEPR